MKIHNISQQLSNFPKTHIPGYIWHQNYLSKWLSTNYTKHHGTKHRKTGINPATTGTIGYKTLILKTS